MLGVALAVRGGARWAVDLLSSRDALGAALARWLDRVVVVADRGLPAVQALTRWDPAGAAARELADRTEVGFPPATRMATVEGPSDAVAEFVRDVVLPTGGELLGPVPAKDGNERVLWRVARAHGLDLAASLKAAQGIRSARKGEPVRVELDPQTLT